MPAAAAFAVDAVLVILFATLGRASHDEGLSASGIAGTAWPFLVALALGWLIAAAIAKTPPLTVRAAWPAWVITVLGGMALRALTGDGTAAAFIVVATVTLGVLLLGWRLLATLLRRRVRAPGRG